MKTKIKTIALIAILSILQVNAQKTYLPVFGTGNSILYLQAGVGTDQPACAEVFVIATTRNSENTLLYDATKHQIYWFIWEPWPPGEPSRELISYSGAYYYPQLKVNEDNSKLWGIRNDKEYLLMDLNLQVGDTFQWKNTTNFIQEVFETVTVTSVYENDGRKIVEFDREIYQSSDWDAFGNGIGQFFPLQFIEGVGPNSWSHYSIVFAKKETENEKDDYQILIPALSDFFFELFECHEYYSDLFSGINNPIIKPLSFIPNPSRDKIQITLPETVTKDTVLEISDLSGRIIDTVVVASNSFVLDISRYAPATYIAVIDINDYRYVGKIIKK